MQDAIKVHMYCTYDLHSKQDKAQKKDVEFLTSLWQLVKYTKKLHLLIIRNNQENNILLMYIDVLLKEVQSNEISTDNKFKPPG